MKGTIRFFSLAIAVALLGALAPAQADTMSGISLGDPPPSADIKMKGVDGSQTSIADVEGEKGTLVIFSCNGCPWVKAWEDRIADLGNTFQARGIGVIAINANDPSQNSEDGFDVMQARANEKGFDFPYVVDATSDVARAFGATRTPEAFLFDRDGTLVYHGAIDDNAKDPAGVKEHYLKDALEAVSTGAEVGVKETKALGCGIKFHSES